MNDRIKELYAKATAWALHNYPPPVNPFEWEDLRSNKFAELIVKECIYLVGDYVEPGSEDRYCVPIMAGKELQEHFGVEA